MKRIYIYIMAAAACCSSAMPAGAKKRQAGADSVTVTLNPTLPTDSTVAWRRLLLWGPDPTGGPEVIENPRVAAAESSITFSLPARYAGERVRAVLVSDRGVCSGTFVPGREVPAEPPLQPAAIEVEDMESSSAARLAMSHNGRDGIVTLDGTGARILLEVRSPAAPVTAALLPQSADNGFDSLHDSTALPRCRLERLSCEPEAGGWTVCLGLYYDREAGELPCALLELADTLSGLKCSYDIRMPGEVTAGEQQEAELAMPPGDYSGITRIGPDLYAVVNDKQDGLHLLSVPVDIGSGGMVLAGIPEYRRFVKGGETSRDCEDIVWYAPRRTLFIAGEGDGRILEYDPATGSKTGRELAVPGIFGTARNNYGFEALTYDPAAGLFWTTTESTLPADGDSGSYLKRTGNRLRLTAFDETLAPCGEFPYLTDTPAAGTAPWKYAFGVPAIAALPDGRLLVLEREFWVGEGLEVLKSYVECRLYLANPWQSKPLAEGETLAAMEPGRFMPKKLLAHWRSDIGTIANYEGMCLGPQPDRRHLSLLLVNDSQSGYAGLLRDYIRLINLTAE